MTRNTHDMELDHHGLLTSEFMATGSALAGYVPISNGDGTRSWGPGGTGGSGGEGDFATTAVVEMAAATSMSLVQEVGPNRATSNVSATLPATPTLGNTIIIATGLRGSLGSPGTLSPNTGFTQLGPAYGEAFDGGTGWLWYKVAGASEAVTYNLGSGVAGGVSLWVGEFTSLGAFLADENAVGIAASTALVAGPAPVGTGKINTFCLITQSSRDNTGSGGASPDYVFPTGWTREINAGVDASGPSYALAWREIANQVGNLTVNVSSTNSDGYGWLLVSFNPATAAWVGVTETTDLDDSSYEEVNANGAFWRATLTSAKVVGNATARIGFDLEDDRTVTLQGSTDLAFTSPVTLDAVNLIPSGTFAPDTLTFLVDTPGTYQYYRLVVDDESLMRVFTVTLTGVGTPGGGGGGPHDLDYHTDVNVPSPDDGDVLTWDASAGEWISAEPTGGGGAASPLAADREKQTSGTITLNSTAWADINNALDLVVAAVAGDVLAVDIQGLLGAQATAVGIDVVTVVSGSPVNSISASAAGDYGFYYGALSVESTIAGHIQYVVQAGDVVADQVTLRLRYKTSSATNRTFYAGTGGSPQFNWSVVNLSTAGEGGGGTMVGELDDLTDVVVDTPVLGQRLRFDGTEWVNSSLTWVPVMTYDGTNWQVAVDGTGNAIMVES